MENILRALDNLPERNYRRIVCTTVMMMCRRWWALSNHNDNVEPKQKKQKSTKKKRNGVRCSMEMLEKLSRHQMCICLNIRYFIIIFFRSERRSLNIFCYTFFCDFISFLYFIFFFIFSLFIIIANWLCTHRAHGHTVQRRKWGQIKRKKKKYREPTNTKKCEEMCAHCKIILP